MVPVGFVTVLGTEMSCDPNLLVPDPTKSIADGAVVMWKSNKRKKDFAGQAQ